MYEARVLLLHGGATENNLMSNIAQLVCSFRTECTTESNLMSNIAGLDNQVIKSESIDGRNNRET